MNSSELQALIDATPDVDGTGYPVDIPAGSIIDLEDDNADGICITLPRRVWLRGNGAILNVPANTIGIDVSDGAQWSEIERITLMGPTLVAPEAPTNGTIGIDLNHGTRVIGVRLLRLEEGLRAHSTDSSGQHRRNCNCVVIEKLFAQWCGKAISLKGADSNQWAIRDAEISTCDVALHDAGFLGGTAQNLLVESCPIPGTPGACVRITESANYSSFVGCYAEGDCLPMEDASQYTIRIGGTFVSQPGGEAVGAGYSRLQFRRPDGKFLVRLPGGDIEAVMDWKHDDEVADWAFKRYPGAGGYYAFAAWANGNIVWPLSWTAERYTVPGEVDLNATGLVTVRQ